MKKDLTKEEILEFLRKNKELFKKENVLFSGL